MEPKHLPAWKNRTLVVAIISVVVMAAILYFSNTWTVQSAHRSTEEAVHSVSDFYLRELAERREQVVASTLNSHIENIYTAIGLLETQDLSDLFHLMMFQARIEKLYDLEKFAFVDTEGLIYTSFGIRRNIQDYSFSRPLQTPEITVKGLGGKNAVLVIAVPVEKISFEETEFTACFIEMEIHRMLDSLSLQTDNNSATFCNLYYEDGTPLTDTVLGGQSRESNLLTALRGAVFSGGSSPEKMAADFAAGREGIASFTYDGLLQSMYYIPVDGTQWMLTYLIRDSMISEQINSISEGIIRRSMVQTIMIALFMLLVFAFILRQTQRASRLALEKETSEAASRAKQQELEGRLRLQNQLLEQEREKRQSDAMITAMASDYRIVYYVDLEKDEGICYRANLEDVNGIRMGEAFPYMKTLTEYANAAVAGEDRAGFLEFIEPENIRRRLEKETMFSHRYLTVIDGQEQYEMLRIADVRMAEERADSVIRAVGIGFSDVDAETRDSMAKRRALSDALAQAKEANAAKTSFLSSMSHEIRTPMNAIIGLDSIALKDPDLPERTREYLEKIGGSAKHLLSLINDILDMSRIESGRMTVRNEEFSFREILEQINTMINGQCQDKGLHYVCRLEGRVEDYYIGDNMKLKQVLINILGNAVKFTPEGGTVSFIVEPLAQFEGNAPLRFVIRDTGVGMDREFIPKIFEAFSQEDANKANKCGSTGLGMAITKNIVEMMNGSITVESEKGAGSTFTVTVPLRMAERRLAPGAEDAVRPQDMRVLVIDDDPVACEHARLVLEEVGVASDSCGSGKEAYELLTVAKARAASYNLILVDLKMPEEDGVAVTRNIREMYGGETAIIILTAYSWDDIVEEALDAGVDSFMAKPLFASNVLAEFQRAVRKKQQTPVKKAELAGRHILLAEDMAINAEIMMEVLGMREIRADHAENGEIAVEMFTKSEVGHYDAVLMDVRMPVLDGLGAARAIRALDRPDAKEIPIIALTANAFDEDVQRSLQAGMNAHLTKPIEPERLYETLENLLS